MFGKLFESMYDGTLASVGPWQALVTFQQMIVLADQDGVVDMTPSAISRRTSIPLEIIEVGIKALEQPDPASRSPDDEGRRITLIDEHRSWGWRIVNYEKYKALRSYEERREYFRRAQADYRARKKVSKTNVDCPAMSGLSTHTDLDTDISKRATLSSHPPDLTAGGGLVVPETPKQPDPEPATKPKPPRKERPRAVRGTVKAFDQFWAAWPPGERKHDKAKCCALWVERALDSSLDVILADVRVKRATRKWKEGFVEAPLVYLRGRRWEDGAVPTTGNGEVREWYETGPGIVAKGVELGLGAWDREKWESGAGGENWVNYSRRVFKAAGRPVP